MSATWAALAYLVLHQRDAVGLATFDQEVRQLIRPSSSPMQLKQLLHVMEEMTAARKTQTGPIFHDLAERLVSRFKWGLVTGVEQPSFETRVAILKSKALVRGFELCDDVAYHVARVVNTNIRELEGAITKLQIQASVEGRDIDLALAHDAIGETPREATARALHSSSPRCGSTRSRPAARSQTRIEPSMPAETTLLPT